MSATVRNEAFPWPTDATIASSPLDPEIPETYEVSDAIFTDDFWGYSHRTILSPGKPRNQEVVDLTTDGYDPSLGVSSMMQPEIPQSPPPISPAQSSKTLAQSATPMQPLTSCAIFPTGSISSTSASPRRCIWRKKPPQWAICYKEISDQIDRAEYLRINSLPTKESQSFRSDNVDDGAMEQHPAARPNGDTRPGGPITGRSTSNVVAQPTLQTADSLEIPGTPSATEQSRCPADPSVVRVMGKRLDAGRPGYLVLCWVYPCQGEIVTVTLDRDFREYDDSMTATPIQSMAMETISTYESQDWNQTRKKLAYPSRQIAEDFLVNSDVRSVDMELI